MTKTSGVGGLIIGLWLLGEILHHWLVALCVVVLLFRLWLTLSPAQRVGSVLGLLLSCGRRW